jgi:hypothetical protein
MNPEYDHDKTYSERDGEADQVNTSMLITAVEIIQGEIAKSR